VPRKPTWAPTTHGVRLGAASGELRAGTQRGPAASHRRGNDVSHGASVMGNDRDPSSLWRVARVRSATSGQRPAARGRAKRPG
jgi:hypothetical protein